MRFMPAPVPQTPDGPFLRVLQAELLERHGPQGWWWPGESAFHIALGAVLVQRCRWVQAQAALDALKAAGLDVPRRLAAADEQTLLPLVRAAGFPRSKPRRVLALGRWWDERAQAARELGAADLRRELLAVEGIGEETADAISLYCFERPAFLCDEYARRVLTARGVAVPGTYRTFAQLLAPGLAAAAFTVPELAELHGLVVEEGKTVARPRPGA